MGMVVTRWDSAVMTLRRQRSDVRIVSGAPFSRSPNNEAPRWALAHFYNDIADRSALDRFMRVRDISERKGRPDAAIQLALFERAIDARHRPLALLRVELIDQKELQPHGIDQAEEGRDR